jgi:hypothetical protein
MAAASRTRVLDPLARCWASSTYLYMFGVPSV